MSLKTQSLRTLSGVDAYARAEGHLVERTTIGAFSELLHAHYACRTRRLQNTKHG